MRCRERSGFLFAHDCDRPAEHACTECNKDVCERHLRGARCITCCKRAEATSRTRARGDDGDADDPYWYTAAHYGDYGYYDDRDRGAFERSDSADASDAFESDYDGS